MSNSLSPKTPLNQDTLERALMALCQPFSIAVFASLAAHGLLAAALPNLLSAQPEEPDTQRKVQVVELSSAEQGQLPQLGINALPTLLPAKPLPPAQSGTKLPDPKLYNDPSFNTIPIFPLPPPNIFPTDFSNLFPKNSPEPKREPKKQATTANRGKPSPQSTNPGTLKKDSATTDKTVGASAQPNNLPQQQITALQAEQQQLQARYAFSGSETTEKAAEIFKDNVATFVDLATKVTGGNADDSRFYKESEKVASLFPKEACPFVGGMRNASFGAIVKPDGTLAEPLIVLLTSGYKGLDTAALEDITSTIKNKKFGDSSKFQIIRFDYTFDPKPVCPKSSKPA